MTSSASDPAPEPRRRPTRLIWSAVCGLALWPLFWAIDLSTRDCGDGLCGFFPGVIGGGGLFLASLGLSIAGLSLGERPRWIALIPLLSIATALVLLAGVSPFG